MYKVMIVDDELWAIKGIRNAFDWDKYGFEITGQFTSPAKAWDAISEEKPDLVFTDIRMPGMSGLDLIRKAKGQELDVEFVIVSGFAEFEYAQEALRYGALDYFLKPVDLDLADQLIGKLSLYFSKKRDTRNNLLLEALTSLDQGELKSLVPQLFDCASACYYRALVLYFDHESKDFRGLSFLEDRPGYALKVESGPRKILYALKAEERTEVEKPWEGIALQGSGISAAGTSSISSQYEHIGKLIKEADLAASHFFIGGEAEFFYYEPKLHLVKPCIEGIHGIVQSRPLEGELELAAGLPGYFRDHRLGMNEVVYLWNQSVSLLLGSYYEELKDMELEFLNYSEIKERFENFESLCSFLQDVLAYIRQRNNRSLQEGDIQSCFNRLVAYIDQHFEQKLYLKDLSAQFFINQVYCCQLFKKNLGRTFSEYVTELRIGKACQLLQQTALSIEEIAIRTGFADYYYFNKVFKKVCRTTPTKFRKKLG